MTRTRWDLEHFERQADALADDTVALLMGVQSDDEGSFDLQRWARANQLMGQWTSNGDLRAWVESASRSGDAAAQALASYARQGMDLPSWTDRSKVERAESIFMDYGPLSCTLLFCASLPECYVIPDLAEVLHIAGQLEDHTEHRIRQTAAMVFPVMLKGGLGDDNGGGIVSVLRVRLIHATIRHLILRGNPSGAKGVVSPRHQMNPAPVAGPVLQRALLAHGWNVDLQGLPCNQVELAYTLLTFSYVFLRGLRTMGLGLSDEDERAVLHTWNVMGHVLGIHEALMVDNMADAEALFNEISAMATLHPGQSDSRPGLGRALMQALSDSIKLPWIRHFPVPMARWLVGARTSDAVGIDEKLSWGANVAFHATMGSARMVDHLVRMWVPGFSLSRLLVRIVGYHLLTRFLLSQTRPLSLPEVVLHPLQESIAGWHADPQAPTWLNQLEDRFTTQGEWRA